MRVNNMRKIQLYILLAVVIIFAEKSVFCQNNPLQLSLDEAVSLALETSEILQIKENEAEKSREAYKEARSALLPGINGDISWARNTAYPLDSKKNDYEIDSGVTASQLLWSFGQVSNTVKAAKKAAEAGQHSRELTCQEVVYNARLSYYAAVLAEKSLDIVRQSYDNALANKELLEKSSFGGRTSKRDRLKMDADIASRRPTVNNAEAQCQSALQTLKTLTGIEPSQDIILADSFALQYKEFEYGALESLLYEQEPSLKVLNKNLEAAEYAVKSRESSFFPTLSAFASWRYAGKSNDDYYVGDQASDHYGAAGLKVTVPLWNGGEESARLRQALADRRNAFLARRQGEENLRLELRNAVSDYLQYRKTLEANSEAVKLAEESFAMTQDMFSAGQVTLSDLNDAELLLTSEKLNRELTLYNINATLAQIEKLAGGELP